MPAFESTPAARPPAYQPTPEESALLKDVREHRKTSPRVAVSKTEHGAECLAADHPDPAIGTARLMQAVGSADADFLTGLLDQLSAACRRHGAIDEQALNFMLSVVKGVEPRDEVEAMMAVQMAAVHTATMTFARRLQGARGPTEDGGAERVFGQLTKTFARQVETLKRYRSGGQQKMTVEHVTVNDGGQAVVGPVGPVGSFEGSRAPPGATIRRAVSPPGRPGRPRFATDPDAPPRGR